MQNAAPQAPPPPTPTPGTNVITPSQIDRAFNPATITKKDVDALLARRSELSRQLNSADGRRRELSRLLRNAGGADRAGLEQRIGVLDARMARLESDIDETGRMLASAPAAYLAQQSEPSLDIGFRSSARSNLANNMTAITIVFTIFVLAPIALSISRVLWKRGNLPIGPRTAPVDSQRIERMEQAMDAIAIEIERVSEGQRFITRLLSDSRAPSTLAQGQAPMDPVRVQAKQTTPV